MLWWGYMRSTLGDDVCVPDWSLYQTHPWRPSHLRLRSLVDALVNHAIAILYTTHNISPCQQRILMNDVVPSGCVDVADMARTWRAPCTARARHTTLGAAAVAATMVARSPPAVLVAINGRHATTNRRTNGEEQAEIDIYTALTTRLSWDGDVPRANRTADDAILHYQRSQQIRLQQNERFVIIQSWRSIDSSCS